MKQPFFQPWVGADYATGGVLGKRVLVLGESHYCGERCEGCGDAGLCPQCCDFTQSVVEAYLHEEERDSWMPTFTKFERSLAGRVVEQAEREQIWNSVVFYNYLQVAMDESRQAGTAEQYEDAFEAFLGVLETHRPDCVIVWGRRLWNALPANERWSWNPAIEVDGSETECGNYALNDGTLVKVLPVYHPSAGYSWDYWHRVIAAFLSTD